MADNPVIGTLTMEDLGKLRKMRRVDAELFLNKHTLTGTERARINELIGRDVTQSDGQSIVIQVHDPTRPLWVLSAWLAGASWRQIAKLHGVAPQTVMAAADRLAISAERQPLRLRTGMSLEALDTYRASFVKNISILKSKSPAEVAQWLLDNTELDT